MLNCVTVALVRYPEIGLGILSQFKNLTIQRFNDSTIQRFNDSTIQRFNDSTIQRFNDSTIQRFNEKRTLQVAHRQQTDRKLESPNLRLNEYFPHKINEITYYGWSRI